MKYQVELQFPNFNFSKPKAAFIEETIKDVARPEIAELARLVRQFFSFRITNPEYNVEYTLKAFSKEGTPEVPGAVDEDLVLTKDGYTVFDASLSTNYEREVDLQYTTPLENLVEVMASYDAEFSSHIAMDSNYPRHLGHGFRPVFEAIARQAIEYRIFRDGYNARIWHFVLWRHKGVMQTYQVSTTTLPES